MINENDIPKELQVLKDKKVRVLEILGKVQTAIQETATVEEVLVMVKLDGEYVRFSSILDDSTETIAILEMLKHDIIRRMST
ncbi:MAG: hypothetical protein CL556_00190 [Alphaproteobacteria bacterium]|nr:hypothetical protein [Alphaproteobacteria bacterium]|tara:strand:+ start:18796 stop:19041 length:246 start_codon:yes stop_codon:yes gene_type:complete